jgi:uncharacterized sulfatase
MRDKPFVIFASQPKTMMFSKPRPRRWIPIWPLPLLLLAVAGEIRDVSASPASPDRRPNMVFILADDLGYGELGCYGQKLIQTPHLDRLAAEGMRFTQFYAGSTVCAPSRSVLMTGQHVGHTRVRGNAGKARPLAQSLQPDDVTVAEVLHAAGYTTALVGKWGLGEDPATSVPNRQGFDFFYGYLNQTHAHNYYPEFLWRNDQRVTLRNRLHRQGKAYEEVGAGWAQEKLDYAPDLMTAEALRWIEDNRDRPFFLYFSPILPHANNEATQGTGNGQEIPDPGIYRNQPWDEPDRAHAAAITRLDADVGRLLALLKRLGLDSHTVVFFSSDNGHHKEGGNHPDLFDANGPLRGMKRDLYEGGIRVPLLARWPGRIRADQVSDHRGYFGDFMATAADLAKAELPAGTDSLSLVPTLLGHRSRQKNHPYLYWEFHERGFHQAVRWGDWKGIRLGTHLPVELYHLKTDLAERDNVAIQHPGVVRQIEDFLGRARTESSLWPIENRP